MPKTKLVRIGGVWRRKSTGGVQYLSGSVGIDEITLTRNEKILIFLTRGKRFENSPDFNMFVERPDEEEPPEEEPHDDDENPEDGRPDSDVPF